MPESVEGILSLDGVVCIKGRSSIFGVVGLGWI